VLDRLIEAVGRSKAPAAGAAEKAWTPV